MQNKSSTGFSAKASKGMEIGLFFGSFNPIHAGHLIIAQAVLQEANLREVWFIVSPQNPLKKNQSLLHEFDRYEMVQLAIADNSNFRVSDIEFRMTRPSFTIDTLVRLSEKYPNHQFRLIMGMDNLQVFPRWKNNQEILTNYGIIIYPRPGSVASEITTHPNIQLIDSPLLDISATYIRKCIRSGKSIKYLVPEMVEDYIRARKLFI